MPVKPEPVLAGSKRVRPLFDVCQAGAQFEPRGDASMEQEPGYNFNSSTARKERAGYDCQIRTKLRRDFKRFEKDMKNSHRVLAAQIKKPSESETTFLFERSQVCSNQGSSDLCDLSDILQTHSNDDFWHLMQKFHPEAKAEQDQEQRIEDVEEKKQQPVVLKANMSTMPAPTQNNTSKEELTVSEPTSPKKRTKKLISTGSPDDQRQ